jgi:hypothetical protein
MCISSFWLAVIGEPIQTSGLEPLRWHPASIT